MGVSVGVLARETIQSTLFNLGKLLKSFEFSSATVKGDLTSDF